MILQKKVSMEKGRQIATLCKLAICLLMFYSTNILAADEVTAADLAKEKLEKIIEDATLIKTENKIEGALDISASDIVDPARPQALPITATDPETKRLYEKALQDYYSYRSKGLEHRGAVFRWQLLSARMIFVIVLGLVICGVIFAGIQFRISMQHYKQNGLKTEDVSSNIEFSKEGMKISSSVVGLIILFLSLAFFYLYLVYVYPIENAF